MTSHSQGKLRAGTFQTCCSCGDTTRQHTYWSNPKQGRGLGLLGLFFYSWRKRCIQNRHRITLLHSDFNLFFTLSLLHTTTTHTRYLLHFLRLASACRLSLTRNYYSNRYDNTRYSQANNVKMRSAIISIVALAVTAIATPARIYQIGDGEHPHLPIYQH